MGHVAVRAWLVAASAAFVLCAAGSAAAHGVSLDLDHPYAENSAFHRNFVVPWAQQVQTASGGRIYFHLHPASTRGGGAQGLYEQVQQSGVDVALVPLEASRERFPRMALMQLPFSIRTGQGGSLAAWEYARLNDVLDRDFDEVRVIALHAGDGTQLHFGKAFSEPPGQVNGLRIAALTPSDAALLSAMGATAVSLPAERIADALDQGTVDAALLSWERAAALGVDRAAKSHLEVGAGNPGMTSTLFVFAMSGGSFRSLADDLKTVVGAGSGKDTAAWLGRVLDEAAAKARQAAAARGDAISVLTPQAREKWLQAARAVGDAQLKALEQAEIPVRPLLQSAREQLQELDPGR